MTQRTIRVHAADGVRLAGIAVPALPTVAEPAAATLDVPWAIVPPAPVQLVSAIAPTPLLLVHGDRDAYFPLEHFRTLAQATGPPATVWVVRGMGHAESGMTAPLAEPIGRWALDAVGGDTTAPGSSAVRDSSGTIRA